MSLKDELRALKLQYAELEQKYKVIKKAAKESKATENLKDSSKSKLSETDDVIGLYAHRFGVMNKLYVTHNAFLQPQPVDVHAENSTQWQTEHWKVLSQSCTRSYLLGFMVCLQILHTFETGYIHFNFYSKLLVIT